VDGRWSVPPPGAGESPASISFGSSDVEGGLGGMDKGESSVILSESVIGFVEAAARVLSSSMTPSSPVCTGSTLDLAGTVRSLNWSACLQTVLPSSSKKVYNIEP